MKRKFVTGIILTLLLLSMLTYTCNTGKASSGLTVYVDPPLVEDVSVGNTFDVYITAREAVDLWLNEVEMSFNPAVIQVVDDPGIAGIEGINPGDNPPYMEFMYIENLDNAMGWLYFVTGRPLGVKTGLSGTVQLAKITFQVMANGTGGLSLHDTTLTIVGPVNVDHETEDGFFSNVGFEVHDIAVTGVTVFPVEVVVGESVSISVTVGNQGDFTETFDVYTRYDDTIIEIETDVTLVAGADTTLTFTWDTTGVADNVYTIKAEASVVPGETDTVDNLLVCDSLVTVRMITSTISISADPAKVTVGEPITISGHITPIRVGATVTIWYRLSGEPMWIILTTTATNPDSQYSYVWPPTTEGVYELKASWSGDETTLPAESPIVTVEVRALLLSIKLAGEHDYLLMESVKIRLAALVKDATTKEPISNADVTIEIYDADGNLWVSDIMVERIAGTGIYEWESERTIRQLRLEKGVYLAHVSASYQGNPTASDILEFHVDPPQEQPFELKTILLVTLMGIVGIIASVWYMDHRRLSRKLYGLQETKH